jgi:hypothetical protein
MKTKMSANLNPKRVSRKSITVNIILTGEILNALLLRSSIRQVLFFMRHFSKSRHGMVAHTCNPN